MNPGRCDKKIGWVSARHAGKMDAPTATIHGIMMETVMQLGAA
jgi:hypothetical protein